MKSGGLRAKPMPAGVPMTRTSPASRVMKVDNREMVSATPKIMSDVEAFWRSEEHTSELQSLMRISYAVFCLKKKKQPNITKQRTTYKEQQHPNKQDEIQQ